MNKDEKKEKQKKYMKEYHARPEVKEKKRKYMKEYNALPEVKARHKEHQKRPEVSDDDFEDIKTYLKYMCKMKTSVYKQYHKKNPSKYHLFELSHEQILEMYEKQEGKCFYSGLIMTFENRQPLSISIDRVDNQKGYTLENTVLCCFSVNIFKGKYDIKDIEEIVLAMAKQIVNKKN